MSRVVSCAQETAVDDNILADLRALLVAGQVFVYPAGNLYGLGASMDSERGVSLVDRLKNRPEGMGISIMGTEGQVRALCAPTPAGERFLDSGDKDVTVVLAASGACPPFMAREGTLAVRLPPNVLCESLVSCVGPVTATSANVHGSPAPKTLDEALEQLGEEVALYIDGGELEGVPTTLVDLTGQQPKVLRGGMVTKTEVLRRYGR